MAFTRNARKTSKLIHANSNESFNGGPSYKDISFDDWNEYYTRSVKNSDADTVLLGKYDNRSSTCYTTVAEKNGYTYFDMGEDWNVLKNKYGYTDDDIYDLFNRTFLEEQIELGKDFVFSHDPVGASGALGKEFNYLSNTGKYTWDASNMKLIHI